MTTAVASPPSFQSLPRLGWSAGSGASGGFNAMSADEVSRMFMPQRKSVQRSNSSSSTSSSSSSASTSTVSTTPNGSSVPLTNGDAGSHAAKKKPRGGFWPTSKAETTTGSTTSQNPAPSGPVAATAGSAVNNGASPVVASPKSMPSQANGVRTVNGISSAEPTAILALLPMNGTFERKQINVPFFPDVLRVGRQTNAKTVPTPVNGFFDSKVLSRQHAEVWAERNGKIWIRDVKSSNGTFVNGQRLSPENRDSEPHELHQHDTLELGIDIVSEDQKTIVHHKVSAKVDYAGLPGNANNVLDLNFGDLDPSHGGPLLASPLSAPMVHSRNRAAGHPPNSRMSSAASVAGSQMNSLAQQRQMNFWGAPLNVEHLVKTLSSEMRAARMQAQDLESTGMFLGGLVASDHGQETSQAMGRENGPSRHSSGRARSLRLDPVTRFAEPPAPPPQQPLPEKPDGTRGSPVEAGSLNHVRRSDTTKPDGAGGSPTSAQSSKILSLVEALSAAKKELDSQAARVQQLEDMLKQEKLAREAAEERVRRLEHHPDSRLVQSVEEVAGGDDPGVPDHAATETLATGRQPDSADKAVGSETELQRRYEHMLTEMQRMKSDMDQFQQRAQTAETEAAHTRSTLADMITRLREQDPAELVRTARSIQDSLSSPDLAASTVDSRSSSLSTASTISKQASDQPNGHIRMPSRLPQQLERAMAVVLRDSHVGGDALAQSAPYISMLGVVLIGVGLMAYLNSWQKAEK